MRIKRYLLTVVLAFLFILMSVATASAEALTETINIFEPVDMSFFVPCAADGTGEWVSFTGNLHVLFHTTVDENGGFHAIAHFQPQGVNGVGSITGDIYQGTGVSRETLNGLVGESFTYIDNFRLIGEGTGNNYLLHETFHITVNANGEVTADVLNYSVECK